MGRDRELVAGATALRNGRGVFVTGPAGVGRTRLATELAARRADVRIVDDAHELDDAAATALLDSVRAGEQVVVTTLTGAAPRPPVTALWKDGHLDRLDLAPLDTAAMTALVDAALPPLVEAATRHALATASGGSPLLLALLVDDALAGGVLVDDDGIWRLRGDLGGPRTADLVTAWIGELDPPLREVLDVLVVAGSLGVARLERLLDLVGLERLADAGHVVVERDGERLVARLAPVLGNGVLERQLSPLRHRRLSAWLADDLAATGARRADDALALAVWSLDGGRPVDPDALVRAALDADRLRASDAAVRLARAAWSAGVSDAGHVLGRLLWLRGAHDEADHILAAAEAAAPDDETRVNISNTRATHLLRAMHDFARATAAHAETRAAVTSARCRSVVDAHLAVALFLRGDNADAVRLAEPLLDPDDEWLFTEAAVGAVPALAVAGRAADAIRIAERAYPLALSLPPRRIAREDPGVHLITLVTAHLCAGDLAAADEMATACYEYVVGGTSLTPVAWFAMLRGNVAEHRGAVVEARRWLLEASDAFDRSGELGMKRVCLAHLASTAAVAADCATATDALADFDALGHVAVRAYDSVAERARSWLDARAGHTRGAVDRLVATVSADVAHGRFSLAAAAAHDIARIGAPAVASTHLDGIPDGDGALVPLRRRHVSALAASDAAELEAVAAGFESLGCLLLAAEAMSDAAGLRAARSEARRAAALARAAMALAERCEGARPPALSRAGVTPARLTPRERELVDLAASGLTNAVIAERLGLSVRTVENHLARAYAKLGVRGRAELTS